jgi:DNA-binding transcriptional LysR family regulator
MDEQPSDWDDYRTVLAVGRAGSLNGAAKALRVSHPTVFRRVNAIERRLGVRLFERARDGYALTAAGEDMVAAAEAVEARIGAAERRLAGRDARPTGTVRMTTTDTLLFGLLPPLLADFRRACPGIVVEAAAGNAMSDLSRREADVALRPSGPPPDALVGRRLADVAFAVYAALDDRGGADADAAWAVPDDSLSHLAVSRWLAREGHLDRASYRAASLLALRDAAEHGLGRAVLPCYLGDASPRLRRLGAPIDALRNELWLLTHPDLRRVARIRAFVDHLRDGLAAQRDLIEGRRPAGPGPNAAGA